MARLNLTCSCGWNFFLPGTTTGHEVSCPNCAQAVRIPGRKPGQDVPTSAGAVAAEHQRRQNIVRLSIGAGVVVIVAGIVFALIPGSKPPPEEKPERRRPDIVRDRPPALPPRPAVTNSQPEAAPPLYTNAQIEEFRTAVLDKVKLINLTTIFAEIIRYRDPQNEAYAKLQTDIAGYEAAIQEIQAKLAKVQQTVDLPLYCAKGDRIISFNGPDDLRLMYPGAAAAVLHNWALTWRAAEAVVQVLKVERAGKEVYITFNLAEESMDLRNLLRLPALTAEVINGVASDRSAVPADLIQRYQAALQALPAGYANLVPSVDNLRITRLLQSKSASAEDAEWFKSRVLGDIVPALEADHKLISKKLADLEPLVKEITLPDAVILKGGQRIECKIVPEGAGFRLKSRGGSRLVTSDDIQQALPDKGIGTEAATRMADSKGNVEKLVSTLNWCTGKPLNNEKQYVACQILLLEPVHDAARTALGIPRPAFSAPKPK